MRAVEAQLRAVHKPAGYKKPNIRTIRRLVEAEISRPRPSLEDIEQLFRRISNSAESRDTLKLISTLRPLLAERKSDQEILVRFRRLLDNYLLELMRVTFESRDKFKGWN